MTLKSIMFTATTRTCRVGFGKHIKMMVNPNVLGQHVSDTKQGNLFPMGRFCLSLIWTVSSRTSYLDKQSEQTASKRCWRKACVVEWRSKSRHHANEKLAHASSWALPFHRLRKSSKVVAPLIEVKIQKLRCSFFNSQKVSKFSYTLLRPVVIRRAWRARSAWSASLI